MYLFNVYNNFFIQFLIGKGSILLDKLKNKFIDFYGGHAAISIGHCHPHFVKSLINQIKKINYYSNSIIIDIQIKLGNLIGKLSGYDDYKLFLCNSGAESVENALKIASFYKKKQKIVYFKGAFHGRTSGAVAITDNYKIISPFNDSHQRIILNHQNLDKVEDVLKQGDVCAVIIEGIQGVAGIIDISIDFFHKIDFICKKYNVILIIDEIQSGYGRTGNFFAHQISNIFPDLITVSKGMGNGFPISGVMISPRFYPFKSMLGTTFGGNYLACTAAISVLEVIIKENILENSNKMGLFLMNKIKKNKLINLVSGRGLMIGLHFNFKVKEIKKKLFYKEHVLVGESYNNNIIRLLPPLNISKNQIYLFIKKLFNVLNE
jgi:acetylornithine/N-succinyldiaminopimelate aminotransferase